MNHLDVLNNTFPKTPADELRKSATGCYYTHKSIAIQMFSPLLLETDFINSPKLKIFDPFAGDGRLVIWLIEFCNSHNLPKVWDIHLFDINEEGLKQARDRITNLKEKGVSINLTIESGDAFKVSQYFKGAADIVVTNPPWEILKPDNRELIKLNKKIKKDYISSMRDYDRYLAENYPISQPKRKFAGWGTNLSRAGAELSHGLLKQDGYCCIVLPASFFADDQSKNIREELISSSKLIDLAYYPAEAKLFDKADVASSSLTYKKCNNPEKKPKLTIFNKSLKIKSSGKVLLEKDDADDYIVPITLGAKALKVFKKLKKAAPTWQEIEKDNLELWAGREIDETGIKQYLSNNKQGFRFIKGRMVNRFQLDNQEMHYLEKPDYSPPESASYNRIAWRDVSRPSQKRRVIATILPKDTIAGNSLGVAYYRNNSKNNLLSLLGIFNSLCFEFQLRFHLATGHVSLSAIRKVHIPSQEDLSQLSEIRKLCDERIKGSVSAEAKIEAMVASQVYGLSKNEFEIIINSFEKITKSEKNLILSEFDELKINKKIIHNLIPNHLSSKLSDLDMKIVRSVPPGGNWKNIPEDIPSKRIVKIRESYARGEGSRSTYYGRLRADMPSYTINTYFNRPGNGCHIHYSQDRVLSQREAARLQSFPDSFEFFGSQTAVNNQIGNAVPPLLSLQIANQIKKSIGTTGVFIDLFAGAGGMGLGFKWAGWKPLLASDIDPHFLETYANNIHKNIMCGSISDDKFFKDLAKECKRLKSLHSTSPFWILGGPPCQGFSTAGKKRTMDDERNKLFMYYKKLIEEVSPDGFIFENVSGLLNMEKGAVFERVKSEFRDVMKNLTGWVLSSEDFAIPQRRKRVILIGAQNHNFSIRRPVQKTGISRENDFFSESIKSWVTVEDALSDLPIISQAENGSHLDYISPSSSHYQKLMRGEISPGTYLSFFS
jgi:DNA (cytosine-5)-methyltransferase 1